MGILAAAIYNANAFRQPGTKPLTPFDFFPEDHHATERGQTLEEQIHILTAVMGCGPGR